MCNLDVLQVRRVGRNWRWHAAGQHSWCADMRVLFFKRKIARKRSFLLLFEFGPQRLSVTGLGIVNPDGFRGIDDGQGLIRIGRFKTRLHRLPCRCRNHMLYHTRPAGRKRHLKAGFFYKHSGAILGSLPVGSGGGWGNGPGIWEERQGSALPVSPLTYAQRSASPISMWKTTSS